MRVITLNMARRSSRLPEQSAALAAREPDVVALQDVTDTTLPLWRVVLERIRPPHVRASLDQADPSRSAAASHRRAPGLRRGASGSVGEAARSVVETAAAAVAATAIGPIEIHCLRVPNAADGWVKAHTLQAIRAGLHAAPPTPSVVCRDLNAPRRELENGSVLSFARDSRGRLRGPEWTRASSASCPDCGTSATGRPIAHSTATGPASRAGPGSASLVTAAAGTSTTVHLARGGASGLRLPPLLARRGPQRPLGRRGRHPPVCRASPEPTPGLEPGTPSLRVLFSGFFVSFDVRRCPMEYPAKAPISGVCRRIAPDTL
jgi:hypothetical protein